MRKLVLYTATSLDGFIARSDGQVDWLESIPNPDQLDYGYESFYASTDTTLMGNNTYRTVLGFGGDFPYADKTNYVFSRQPGQTATPFVRYVTENAITFVQSLKKITGKTIWLVGGSQLNTAFLQAGLIDKLIITLVPVLVGTGIPLFSSPVPETSFRLLKTKAFDTGFVQLTYVPLSHRPTQ